MKYKKQIVISFIALFSIATLVSLLNISGQYSNMQFDDLGVRRYDLNLNYQINSDVPQEITLPYQGQTLNPYDEIKISGYLPHDGRNGNVISFRTYMQAVKVYLDGKLIYINGYNSNGQPKRMLGHIYHFVELPDNYVGKSFQILLSSPYGEHVNCARNIFIGSKFSCINYMVMDRGMNYYATIICLIVGLTLLLITMFNRNFTKINHGCFLMAMLTIFSGVWIASQCMISQIVIKDPFIMSFVEHISLFLILPTFNLLVYTIYRIKKYKILKYTSYIYLIAITIAIVLQLTMVVDLTQFIKVFHIITCLDLTLVLVIVIVEVINHNSFVKSFLLGTIIITVFAVSDVIRTYMINSENASKNFQVGLIIFMTILLYATTKNLFRSYSERLKHKALKQLAYTDIQTGFFNRTAFARDVYEIKLDLELMRKSGFIIYDINNLKQTNDTLGHIIGDKIIESTAEILKKANGEVGNLYRTGGDEFVVITKNLSQKEYERVIHKLKELIDEYNNKNEVPIYIAYGQATYNKDIDADFENVFSRADSDMYKTKKEQKARENSNV